MPLQPSRRDVLGPPPRDVSDLASIVRHQGSYARSLNPGILDGRFATPRPVGTGPSQIVGDDGGDGDAEAVIGEDGDRLTLANLGTQVWTLSYTPISETLVVRWHPDAGAGVEWKRGEHYELAEDDQIVTIYASALASGRAQVGDVFSAQYLRLDGEEDDPAEPPALATATIRGDRSAHYGSGPMLTAFELPTGTVIGDMIAVTTNGDITDGRMTQVGSSNLWLGFASTLTDLSIDMTSTPSSRWAIACITLDTNAVGWSAGSTASDSSMHVGDSFSVPQLAGETVTVCAIYDTHGIVDGGVLSPTGYTTGSGSATAKQHVRVDLWTSATEAVSPAGPVIFNGGAGLIEAVVVSLTGP